MQLFAERFAIEDDGRVVDLASGRCVVLRQFQDCETIDPSQQIRWTMRCDRWLGMYHRYMARLVDYGLVGPGGRFEAWDCGAAWKGSADEDTRARLVSERFLAAAGLSGGGLRVHVRDGVAVGVPGDEAGYDSDASIEAEAAPIAIRGLARIQRCAVAALAELLDDVSDRRAPMASLWGHPGSGAFEVARELARAARLKGFVPITSRLLCSRYALLWRGRALFVIHDQREGDPIPWPAVLSSTLDTPLAHPVLIIGREEVPGVHGIGLQPVNIDDLMASIVPSRVTPRLEEQIRRAAQASAGRPGRFARLLWPDWMRGRSPRRRDQALRAAEQSAQYGHDDEDRESAVTHAVTRNPWPAPGELATLRSQVAAARADLAAGRHAPALRALRTAAAALARRDACADAAAAGLIAAAALLGRGRPREAIATAQDVRVWAERCGATAAMLDAAILAGEARTDLMRFGEAETILAAAVGTARHARDHGRVASASIGLARCLFWRGEYAEAAHALDRTAGDATGELAVRRDRLMARVQVGRGDLAGALATLAALQRESERAQPAVRSAVACTAAFVYLCVGDLDAASRSARDSIAQARLAHDPLRGVRARLLLIETERRRGRRIAAHQQQLDHLGRRDRALPPILRARRELVARLSSGSEPGSAASGALTLLAPAASPRHASNPGIDDLLVILRACQTADDETVVLTTVCAHVRRQLHAIAIAFVTTGPAGRCDLFVSDGARVDVDLAVRAMGAGVVIRPHRYADRVGAAAPVLYGGVSIGALCVRWSVGSDYDPEHAATLLATAATAAAPMLAAALAHRARTVAPEGAAVAQLLGVTTVMAGLRDAVQRAGAAPFAVLIAGESGSGKELVARAIHRSSGRRDGPFCTLNCAAVPDDLVESELFGHSRGAFTGAVADRPGVFEEAHGGTLFLDEIGELSPRAQAKILRVIQEGELRRVGENIARRIDARLIAATNRDLGQEVEAGRFRLDLRYRLDVIRITVPPLRDRPDDVPVLAAHFWADATARVNSRATLAAGTVAALARYHWPGNVRELQNVLAALAVRCPRRGLVPPSALPPQFQTVPARDECWRLDAARRTFEERFVRAALVRTGGHRTRAAAELGVTRQGLTKLLARLGIADGC